MSWVVERAREDIRSLAPYSHATWEPSFTRLHANELPWRIDGDASQAGLNRYPEPQPRQLLAGLAQLYGVGMDRILVGRGSDDVIDLLLRVYCRAGKDSVIVCPPTFGMYGVSARIQGAEVRTVPLLAESGFALDEAAILSRVDDTTRLVFACTPNNPTANTIPAPQLERLAIALAPRALLVVDEAYIDFASVPSMSSRLEELPNVAVIRTLSKAHGLAGARVGALLADPAVITLVRRILPPYAIAGLTVEAVTPLLRPAAIAAMRANVVTILEERDRLVTALAALPLIKKVWPSDANFLLADCTDATTVLGRARRAGILIRDVRQPMLPDSVRISVGTPEQNSLLLGALR